MLTETRFHGGSSRNDTFDALGRVTARQWPLGQQESFIYDAAGNRIEYTDFNGQLTHYDYDAVQRLRRQKCVV